MRHEDKAESRRSFLAGVAGAGALLAWEPTAVLAQDKAAATPTPPAPPGTIPNDAVKREKSAAMQYHSERPLTGSVPAHEHDFDVTPTDRFYIRNNLLTPDIDAAGHRLAVKGLVEREMSLSIDELKKTFAVVTVQGMLECAGSGRQGYQPRASGTPWLATGGMGCAKWTGVRLADLLRASGLKDKAGHVAGQGGDPGMVPTAAPVIRSIPIAKAMDGDTLVAFEMNGSAIPKVHGHPLRLLVPGWVGSASTKWLHTLTVLDAPFKGSYMDRSYRVPKWSVKPGERMPPDTLSTEAWPVKSIINFPAQDAVFKGTDRITVRGRAWVGEGEVDRVEISTDEGVTWQRARLAAAGDKYAWRTFTFDYQPQRFGYVTFLARAWDDRGSAQPMLPYWNPLGYFWNAVHRVGVVIVA